MWKFYFPFVILGNLLSIQNGYSQQPIYARSNSPVCSGLTLELKAACGTSYSWSGPNGFSSTVQSPKILDVQLVAAGNYYLTITDNFGEPHVSTIVVVVNPTPIAEASGEYYYNPMWTTTLFGNASGGLGPDYTYRWEPANRLVNANVQNPTAIPYIRSTWFKLVVTDVLTGCFSKPDTFLAIEVDLDGYEPVADKPAICSGESSLIHCYTTQDSIFYEFQWSSDPPGFSSTFTTFTVTPDVTTDYRFKVNPVWGPMYYYDTVTVTVFQSIPQIPGTISGPSSICKGSKNIQYSIDSVANASSYLWTLPNGFLGQSTTNSIVVDISQDASPGVFSVVAKNPCGFSPESMKMIAFATCPVEVKADTVIACNGNQVLIPIKVKNFRDIGKFSLTLMYDSASVSYAGYQNVNAGILPVTVTNTTGSPSIITISSTTPFGVSVQDDEQLLTLVFAVKGGTTALTWNTAEPNNSKFFSPCGQTLLSTLTNGLVRTGVQLTGHVMYDNVTHSSLSGVHVVLKQNGIIEGEVVTDQNGHYSFPDVCPGNYTLQAHSIQPWGGCNSIDALLILKHFVGISILEDLPFQAAETDASGYINSTDALLVLKRFTGLSISFPTGDWVFESKSISITENGNNQLDIKGLCAGDINGSDF